MSDEAPTLPAVVDTSGFDREGDAVAVTVRIAGEFEVTDDDSVELAIDLMRTLTDARNSIEEQRKALVGPIKAVTSTIDAAAREHRRPIEEAIAALRVRVNEYNSMKATERAQAEAERRALEAQTGQVTDPGELPDDQARQVVTSGGNSAHTRTVPVAVLIDLQAFVKWLAVKKNGATDDDWALLQPNLGEAQRQCRGGKSWDPELDKEIVHEARESWPPGWEVQQSSSVVLR